jgi:hypothetical protein
VLSSFVTFSIFGFNAIKLYFDIKNKKKGGGENFEVSLIRVITKLPKSEQSYKGKVKTHKYINRPNQSTTGKL